MTDRKLWRAVACNEPLLAAPRALGHEYERAAVNRPYGDEPCEGVYVIDVHGPLEHHEHVWFASFEHIQRITCTALERADVRAVILRIDSPGGVANGMAQASRSLRAHADRQGKLLYAYADEQICSAAYGIACAADEIWGPRTSEIGSVGVILPVVDQTQANENAGVLVDLIVTGERKGDGHPDKPLDSATRDALQARVDAIGDDFFALVGEARGMTPDAVRALQAGVFVGTEAVSAGLADGVADWQEFFEYVKTSVNSVVKAENVVSSKQSATKRRKVSKMARTKRLSAIQAQQEIAKRLEIVSQITDPQARTEAIAKLAATISAESKMGKKSKMEDDDEDKKKSKYEAEIDEEDDAEDDAEDDDKEPESERGEDDGEDNAEDDAEDDKDDDAEDDAEDDKDDDEPESKRGEEEPKKARKAKASSVIGLVRSITGSASRAVQLGKLDAMAEKAARFDAMAADVARLKKIDRTSRVESLIKSAIDAKKIAPSNAKQIRFLREQGMDSPKRLKAYIDAMPRLIQRTLDDGPIGASLDASGALVHTDSLSAAARNVIETTARLTGKSIEAATADYLAAFKRAAGR